MSLCSPIFKVQPINYCGADQYGPGTLTIGNIDPVITDVIVLMEDLATGRTTHYPSQVVAGVVTIDMPGDLTPGRMYEVTLDGGIPFQVQGSNDLHMSVWLNVRKVFDGSGMVVSAPTQVLTA